MPLIAERQKWDEISYMLEIILGSRKMMMAIMMMGEAVGEGGIFTSYKDEYECECEHAGYYFTHYVLRR